MKTMNLLTLTVAAGSLLALTSVAQAGVVGSPHDFHAASWNSDPTDPATVCSVCHTPHHADPNAGPLWNRTVATSGFIMYKDHAPAENIKSTPSTQPTGVSLACLSCHDGQTAINAYGGSAGTSGNTITNSANLTRDLSHSHPISLTYDSALVGTGPTQNKWLYPPDTTPVLQPDSGTFVAGNDMTIKGFLLGKNNRLECNSCHDVHNQEGTPYSLGSNPKLVKINGTQAGVGSLLCRSCHNK
ncbi:MAG: hypothetical protein NTZ16_14575 [Verrucomicrobia bacterium]|nr:hypothetical protein [Verrucomicrobiota bacterium]